MIIKMPKKHVACLAAPTIDEPVTCARRCTCLCWRVPTTSFGVEKSPHLLVAFTISKLKWLYHINSGTTKVYSGPRRAVGGVRAAVAVCLCNSATYEPGSLSGDGRVGLRLDLWRLLVFEQTSLYPVYTICLTRNVGRLSTPQQLSCRFQAHCLFVCVKAFVSYCLKLADIPGASPCYLHILCCNWHVS